MIPVLVEAYKNIDNELKKIKKNNLRRVKSHKNDETKKPLKRTTSF